MKTAIKIVGFGLLLWVVIVLVQLIISAITSSYETLDKWWANGIVAVFMAFFAGVFSRLLRAANTKQAWIHGIGFASVLVGISAILIIPNGANAMFGHWSTYLVFVGAAVGPALMKSRKTLMTGKNNGNPNAQK
ncbi:MAG: hypothetical protein WC497_06155 [Patescibacteria group bacterium]